MQGENRFGSGAYTLVREHFEAIFNAAARRLGLVQSFPSGRNGLALAFCAAFVAQCEGRAQTGSEAQRPPTDWIDFTAIDAGEVAVRTEKGEDSSVLVDVAVQIDAERQTIWDILKACEIAPEYVPNVVACELIDSVDDGQSELFIQTVKPAFFIPKFEHVFRLDYDPPLRMGVRRVSGPIAEMDGAWWLLERGDGILLMHTLRVRPGIPVPRLFVRATLRRDLPIVLEAVRDRAEAIDAD